MTVMAGNPSAEDVVFFSTLSRAAPAPNTAHRVIELAWLLMSEGFPILEDLDGANRDVDLTDCLKFDFARFLADLDARLIGGAYNNATHELAAAIEYGSRALCGLDGPGIAMLLGLSVTEDHACTAMRIRRVWNQMLRDFPVALVDPLQPNTQGEVLRRLRVFIKLCEANGVDTTFLVEMMKAV